MPVIERQLVEVVTATAVRVGDTIWVHDDRDWMKVARVERNEYERTFYRADTSEATFDKHDMAVRLVSATDAMNGPAETR